MEMKQGSDGIGHGDGDQGFSKTYRDQMESEVSFIGQ